MNHTKDIKDLTSDEKNLMAFYLLLSDPAFDAWTGEKKITPGLYREICQTASRFMNPELMIRIAKKFPGMTAGSHL